MVNTLPSLTPLNSLRCLQLPVLKHAEILRGLPLLQLPFLSNSVPCQGAHSCASKLLHLLC